MRLGVVILLLCLGVLLGVPVLWQRTDAQPPAAEGEGLKLVILTPHNQQIRHEIGVAFSAWHASEYGQPVRIDWRAGSGTSDIERILLSEYEGLLENGSMDDGIGYDILFGGGDYFFGKMTQGVHGQHSVLEPIDLGESFMKQVYPEPTIADKPLYDPNGHWFGIVLSSFGIVFNHDVLADLGIENVPATWEDLADERLFRRVALADPGHSGSVRVTYEAIVQRYGWERGWATIRRACANARYFAVSSSKVPLDVSAGHAAAGMCIDFYGRYQGQVVGVRRCDYAAPPGATVVTADPVGILRGCERKELAIRFIRFLLSEPGQKLWSYRMGEPGGPEQFELRRPPVRRDMYTPQHLSHMADATRMFEIARPLPPGTPSYFGVIPTVMHAMAIDIHDDLQAAWRTIIEEKDAARKAEMIQIFDALPFTQEQLLQAAKNWDKQGAKDADRLAWTKAFRAQYRRVVEMGAE